MSLKEYSERGGDNFTLQVLQESGNMACKQISLSAIMYIFVNVCVYFKPCTFETAIVNECACVELFKSAVLFSARPVRNLY